MKKKKVFLGIWTGNWFFISGHFMFYHWMALPTGSTSRSRDHFSAKFGLRRPVYMFGRNLRVVEGSVLKKTGGCAAIEFQIIKLTCILYYLLNA